MSHIKAPGYEAGILGCLPFSGKKHLVWKHVKGMQISKQKIQESGVPFLQASVSLMDTKGPGILLKREKIIN